MIVKVQCPLQWAVWAVKLRCRNTMQFQPNVNWLPKHDAVKFAEWFTHISRSYPSMISDHWYQSLNTQLNPVCPWYLRNWRILSKIQFKSACYCHIASNFCFPHTHTHLPNFHLILITGNNPMLHRNLAHRVVHRIIRCHTHRCISVPDKREIALVNLCRRY